MTHGLDDKERVRQATDLVDLVGSYLQLRRQGSNYVATCPWHDDQRPSLQINPARQTWKCWVCDIGGDVFSFVMKRENIDFREALQMLAERSGVVLTSRPAPKTEAGNPNDKPTLYRAIDWAARQYHHCLLNDPSAEPARRYIAARGITEQAIERFGIGFAPDSWDWLQQTSRDTGFSRDVLMACGLLVSNDRGGAYERFRGRLMFPIHDTQGRVIAFGGRVIPELAEQEEAESGRTAAKYINSPETRLYSKSDNLFGLHVARESLQRERHLIVVEGYTDVVGTWMAGIENCAAVCGTALNQRHIRVIRRFADRITLVLDGDTAGQRRTNEVLEHFVAAGADLRIMTLPEGQDPCDFVQARGAAAFRARIEQAADALDHKLRIETDGIDLIRDTHAANQALERILQTLAGSPGDLDRSPESRLRTQQLMTRISRLFQVDIETLHRRLAEARRARHRGRNDNASDVSVRSAWRWSELPAREIELLQLMLQGGSLLDQAVENVSPEEFQPGACHDLYQAICDIYHDGGAVDFESLMLRLEDADLKHLLDRLDEEFQAKVSKTEVELTELMTAAISAFDKRRHDLAHREAMSSLTQSKLKPEEEAEILERMFQQARERQGIQ